MVTSSYEPTTQQMAATQPADDTLLTGSQLRKMFRDAHGLLERHVRALNAINVFPVPDGDTGANLLLTVRAAVDNVPNPPDITIGEFFKRLWDGAFWGARGNSGVIFSQFLAGMAAAFESETSTETSGGECSGTDLERAFRMGAEAAYKSVGNPVEGTMLTVLNSLAPAVAIGLRHGEPGVIALWEAAFNASREALAKTPDQLPVLQEAGVVDAGGMGVVVILGGALEQLTGRVHLDLPPAASEPEIKGSGVINDRVGPDHLIHSLATDWGYCIQFVIQANANQALNLESIRERLVSSKSDSAVVAGGGDAARVHVHASNPAPMLTFGSSLGDLQQVNVQSMDQQNHEFVKSRAKATTTTAEVEVIAVATGGGLTGLFLDTGCAAVVSGGQRMNPSVEELLDSAGASGAKHTILLPNNSNVVAAARQAAVGDSNFHVVAATSIPQGIAALLAFLAHASLEENLAAMEEALTSVKSIEVTQAVRDASIDGLAVKTGEYLAILDGHPATVDSTAEIALMQSLGTAGLAQDGLVTVYVGADANWRQAEDLAASVQRKVDGLQVDVIYGGQPNYHYLASVE